MRHNLVLQVAAGTTSCTTHEQIAAALAKGQAGRQGCRRAGRRASKWAGGRTGRLEGGQVDEEAVRKVGQPRMRAGKLY